MTDDRSADIAQLNQAARSGDSQTEFRAKRSLQKIKEQQGDRYTRSARQALLKARQEGNRGNVEQISSDLERRQREMGQHRY